MNSRHVGLAVLVALIWGVNFVLIRVGLASFPPLFMGALRFAIAAVPVLALKRPDISWRKLAAISMTLFVGQFALLFPGMALGMPPGLASVTLQVQAFFTIIIAAALLGEVPRRAQIAGAALACIGLVVIALTAGTSEVSAAGFALTVGAAASWAAGNVLLRRAGKVDAVAMVSWLSLLAAPPLLLLSLLLEGADRDAAALAQLGWHGVGAILYIAVLSTTIGFALWGHLLKLYPAGTVAPFSLLVPTFGTLAAFLVFGEHFGALRLAGMGLILAGLALVVAPGRRRLI